MKKGEKRKIELLKIAYELFISKGYENTSVDEIISRADIAKGTYYYYFKSKEQMLEDVIDLMIESEAVEAEKIACSNIPVPRKIAGVITSLSPKEQERSISEQLHKPENALMHLKTRKKLISVIVPLLSKVVEEGIEQGIFSCDNIEERVRMILELSDAVFNEDSFTDHSIEVFIDITEKILGAGKGTMGFIEDLIGRSEAE